MKRFTFTENEYTKLANLTGLSMLDIQKLDALGLLENTTAVKKVMEIEYKTQRQLTHAAPRLILQAVANKYGMTPKQVRRLLYNRATTIYFCKDCGIEVARKTYKRNDGLCDQGLVKHINYNLLNLIEMNTQQIEVLSYYKALHPKAIFLFHVSDKFIIMGEDLEMAAKSLTNVELSESGVGCVDYDISVMQTLGDLGKEVKVIEYYNDQGRLDLPDVKRLKQEKELDY